MLQSKLPTKTRKEAPSDEVSKNAKFLTQGGFVEKLQAGVYTYLPLGLRVLKKIENIIREEMNNVGGVELLMPSLQPKENWMKTGRWDSMDDLYKVTDSSGKENALGPTHEEVIVPLAKQFISSYRDLPLSLYQIQNKFRMELRAKSGILRGREFLMKDLYSFHENEADLDSYYNLVKEAYSRIFNRAGIGSKTYLTFATGGSFSKYSHEFQAITEAGEDTIYLDEKKGIAVNKEVLSDEILKDLNLDRKILVEKKSIEVGNIFKLMTKYSDPFSLTYKGKDGKPNPVIMGCYGIGLSRLMGAAVEILSDSRGIVWPEEIAPFKAHLIVLGEGEAMARAKKLYEELAQSGIETLFDEREGVSAGEKFADSDLIGIPYRIVISEKTIAQGGVEIKRRGEEAVRVIQERELIGRLT